MMPDDKDIDLSEDLFETAAKQLREDIDWEVYSDLLVTNFNWHRVRIDPEKAEAWQCVAWLHQNCAGRFDNYGAEFVFKDIHDLEWFVLRWS